MEIMMGKPKTVSDSAMVTELGDDMLVIGKPTVVHCPKKKNGLHITPHCWRYKR